MKKTVTLALAGVLASAAFATTASARQCGWYGGRGHEIYACKMNKADREYGRRLKGIHDGWYGKPDKPLEPIYNYNSGAFPKR